jgi:maltooligosyltrehalose trehalohydrolase
MPKSAKFSYKSTFGATILPRGRACFSLWAPGCPAIDLVINGQPALPMLAQKDGWFSLTTSCKAGDGYRFRLPSGALVPDPASRAQMHDVHDASLLIDPRAYSWRHPQWRGRPWHEAVIYEIHPGLAGGFAGIEAQLPYLAALGVTAIELMPIADFPGQRNWGYDGVLPYAPDTSYGTPEQLKSLIDAAHGCGLMILLDVVYNHFGPDGNYLPQLAPQFYRHDRTTPWGDAIDVRQNEVKQFFIQNALYWLIEYRFDGLRFDAVHALDDSEFLREMARDIRRNVEMDRHVHLILENENNDASLLGPVQQGIQYDAQWADDFHHAVHVLLTGEDESYYEEFAADPAVLLAKCLAEGFAFPGGPATNQNEPPLPTTAFVICLQNHDQIGNRAMGERLAALAHPKALRAATLVLLLTPQIPLLFMGQETGSSQPFLYFTDHHGELADAVREGRRREFAKFTAFTDPKRRARIPDPNHPDTFAASMIDIADPGDAARPGWLALHQELLATRAKFITPFIPRSLPIGAQALGRTGIHAQWRLANGAVLTIAANFAAAPLLCPVLDDDVIFAIPADAHCSAGTLAGHTAIATLRSPA